MIIVARLAAVPEDTVWTPEALEQLADQLVPVQADLFELNGKSMRIVEAWVEGGWLQAKIEVPADLAGMFGPPSGGYLGMSVKEIAVRDDLL